MVQVKQPTRSSQMTSEVTSEVTARLVVTSNWGDAGRVGLTEIQFLDSRKRKVVVVLSSVSMAGAGKTMGGLSALFNGKSKVTLRTSFICLIHCRFSFNSTILLAQNRSS